MRIGIYARVSTKDQSCELQLRIYGPTARREDLNLPANILMWGIQERKSPGPSLTNSWRTEAQFDAIVVWRFDRFARFTKHLLMALEEFRSLGIQFVSYQENIDTSSSLGQALFTIVSAVAQLERDLIRERVSAGIRNARANGKKL